MPCTTKERSIVKDPLGEYQERFPEAGEARLVDNQEFSNLGKNHGFSSGPDTRQMSVDGHTVTIIVGLVKKRKDHEKGEIIYARRE